MDYTTVPRSLIYRERRSLEEFGVYEKDSITRPLADSMLRMGFIQQPYSENIVLWCFNTAFYICTMFLMEKDPRWRIGIYKQLAAPKGNLSTAKCQNLTLSLVVLLLDRLLQPIEIIHPLGAKALVDIYNWVNNKSASYMFSQLNEELKKDSSAPKTIPNSMFAPRVIDKETVKEVLMVPSFNWSNFLNYFERRSVSDIVWALGSTEEEKMNVVDIIRQASHSYYTSGFNDRPEQVDNMLNDIEGEIYLHYNYEAEQALMEAEIAEREKHDADLTAYETRIKELEEEIEKLKSENKELKEQQPSADNHDEIDELKEEIANLKKETGKLSSKEAAILTITACYHAGGLPPNRENLYPILTNLFGVGESLAKRRLREGVNKKSAEALAKCFDEVSPVIARTLREMPEKLKNKKKK